MVVNSLQWHPKKPLILAVATSKPGLYVFDCEEMNGRPGFVVGEVETEGSRIAEPEGEVEALLWMEHQEEMRILVGGFFVNFLHN